MEDREFIRQFMMVLGVLAGITISIFILARLLTGHDNTQSPLWHKTVQQRLEPVGTVNVGEVPVQTAKAGQSSKQGGGSAKLASGKAVYQAVCSNCHKSGVAGAPKYGNSSAWAPRIKQGKKTLYHSALNGKGAMPAKGGRSDLTEKQVKMGVDYMVKAAK